MTELQENWTYLKHLSKMETPEDIKSFEKNVWSLAETREETIILSLIDLFDDDCPYYEVMYSLVHALETVPKEIYIPALIKKIKNGVERYPFWIDCLCNRVFNDDLYLSYFRKNMHLTDRSSLLKLFDLMEQESPHHRDLIQELRTAIKNQNH